MLIRLNIFELLIIHCVTIKMHLLITKKSIYKLVLFKWIWHFFVYLQYRNSNTSQWQVQPPTTLIHLSVYCNVPNKIISAQLSLPRTCIPGIVIKYFGCNLIEVTINKGVFVSQAIIYCMFIFDLFIYYNTTNIKTKIKTKELLYVKLLKTT